MTSGAFIRRPAPLAEARERYVAGLRESAGRRQIVVWGAGRAGEIAIASLRAADCAPAWVADRNVARHGAEFLGLRIGSPDALDSRDVYAVLASMYAPTMARDLESRGWVRSRDFREFPAASIYQPDFGFLLAETGAKAGTRLAPRPVRRVDGPRRVTLLASSRGNFFFRELRSFLAAGLRQAGWHVVEADERASSVDGVPIVVGPHEFFSIGEGSEWFSEENLARAVIVATEQPQSLWFREFAPACALAVAIVDISPNGAAAWRARGVDAAWLPLGWFAGCDPFDRLPDNLVAPVGTDCVLKAGPLADESDDAWSDRPIDVLFIGAHSPRREGLLRDLRERLGDLRWFVHLPGDRDPLVASGRGAIDTATFVGLARQSKVLLNLHRDDAPFWEWQRIVWRGLWQRTLVVTEPTGVAVDGIVAGRDLLEAPADELSAVLADVFADVTGRARADAVRRSGCRQGREAFPFAAATRVLGEAVDRVGQ